MLDRVRRDPEDRTLPERVLMPFEVSDGGGLDDVAWCFVMTVVDGVDVSLRGITSEDGKVGAPEAGEGREEGMEGSLRDDSGGSLGWHTGEVGAGRGEEKLGEGIGGAMREGKASGYLMGLKGEDRTS